MLTTNNSFDIYWSDANMYLPVGTRRTFPVHLNAPLGYGDGVSRFITYLRWPPAGTSGFEVVQVVPQSVSSGFEIVSGPVDNTNGRVPIQSGVVRPGYLLRAETCIADVTIRTFGVPGVWEMWTSDSQVYRRDGTQVPVAQRPIRVNVTQPPSVRTDGAS